MFDDSLRVALITESLHAESRARRLAALLLLGALKVPNPDDAEPLITVEAGAVSEVAAEMRALREKLRF